MMAETRCPYCGASEDANGPRLTFECGTGGSCEGSVIRAAPCYLRQLASANAKIAELQAKNKRVLELTNDSFQLDTSHPLYGMVHAGKLAAILNEKGS